MMFLVVCLVLIVCMSLSLLLYTPKKKYNLCLMGIFKNEQDYLEEWIVHHKNQGISHVYLYCNDPIITNYDFLYKSEHKDFITLIQWTDVVNDENGTIQRKAYTDCMANYSHECQYLMMLDIDEFLVALKPYNTVMDYFSTLNSKNTKALKVMRFNYGSSGHVSKPKGNVVDNYKKREKICSSYKTIANTDYLDRYEKFYGVHDFPFLNKTGKIYNNMFYYKNNNPHGCSAEDVNEIPLVINHYYTKSYDEYMKRCDMWKDGGVNNIGYRRDCVNKFKSEDINEIVEPFCMRDC